MEIQAILNNSADSLEDQTIISDYSDETVGIREYSVSSYGIDYDIEGIRQQTSER